MVNRGTNQQSSAPYNRRIVLDVIRRHGSLSRKEIVDRVALSPQTVANITSDLESVGLVVARRLKVQKSRGQPPIVFELNPNGGTSIGITIEPGRVRAALVNLVGKVIRKQDVEVDTHDRRGTLTVMVSVVNDLAGVAAATGPVRGVGVALPGPFAVSSMSFVGPTVLEGWTDLSALDELHRISGFPVIYSVDSVAGALGESLFGIAKNLNNFFYMHFGVGLGGTLVANRSAYKGANSNATEIGHVPIVPDGKVCYCGNKGCLERYLSLHSLAEALGRADVKDGARELLVEMLAAREPTLMEWCREAAVHLRNAVCMIENLLDPETIVIGGSAPKALVEHIVALAQPLHGSVRADVASTLSRILLSEHDEDSSILGAAVLPVYEMLSPRFEMLLQKRPEQSRVEGLLGGRAVGGLGRL
ncbi:MAG TPA: ROK family transcriptional regulator [Steroidobacteraceae bacterium]|nr:ROK family transcriptional regulator [Steroidobacteraceae bacterium]